MTDTIQVSRAEYEALRRDAERYRRLRNEAIRDYVEFNDNWYEDADDLDAAVDALPANGEGESDDQLAC
jgi:hypothetical protein